MAKYSYEDVGLTSNRIKEIRTEKGLSTRALGKMVGLTDSAVSLYENGKRMPSLTSCIQFAKALDVSLDYLLCITDIKTPYGKATVTKQEVPTQAQTFTITREQLLEHEDVFREIILKVLRESIMK